MSGYLLLPRELLDLYGGTVPTYPERFGLLDFLRELEEDPLPFQPRAQICLLGTDELLIRLGCAETDTGAREGEFLQDVRRRLRRAARELDNLPAIQVPITFEMVEGATGHVSVRHARDLIPLWRIFGEHPEIREIMGRTAYQYGSNLT